MCSSSLRKQLFNRSYLPTGIIFLVTNVGVLTTHALSRLNHEDHPFLNCSAYMYALQSGYSNITQERIYVGFLYFRLHGGVVLDFQIFYATCGSRSSWSHSVRVLSFYILTRELINGLTFRCLVKDVHGHIQKKTP